MSRRSPRSLAELRPTAQEHLDRYTDPAGSYAFATYDQAEVHDGPITAADVLMANLLSLQLGWRDVIPLFADTDSPQCHLRHALNAVLVEARALPALEDCDDVQIEMPALRRANELAHQTSFPGRKRSRWTAVTVSKVLHRLARNVPLVDSTVRSFYRSGYAGVIRKLIRDDLVLNHGWLTDLADGYHIRGQPMALTRVADILIWMDASADYGS
jgi:uncharacterized protein DUF6308